jgi:predicted DNA-binding transcriptional regulator AlpA
VLIDTIFQTDTLLREHQVAREFNLNVRSLQRWRSCGCGPRYLKLNRTVRYRRSDVERWMTDRCFANTAEARTVHEAA